MVCSIQKWQEARWRKAKWRKARRHRARKVVRPESRRGRKTRSDGRWTGNEWMRLSGGNVRELHKVSGHTRSKKMFRNPIPRSPVWPEPHRLWRWQVLDSRGQCVRKHHRIGRGHCRDGAVFLRVSACHQNQVERKGWKWNSSFPKTFLRFGRCLSGRKWCGLLPHVVPSNGSRWIGPVCGVPRGYAVSHGGPCCP